MDVSALCDVFLTRLSSVASKEFSLALLAHLPCDAGSKHPVSRLAVSQCTMPSGETMGEGLDLQKDAICQVDNGVGRRKRRLTHDVFHDKRTALQ